MENNNQLGSQNNENNTASAQTSRINVTQQGGGAGGYDADREQQEVNREREDMNSERDLDDLNIEKEQMPQQDDETEQNPLKDR